MNKDKETSKILKKLGNWYRNRNKDLDKEDNKDTDKGDQDYEDSDEYDQDYEDDEDQEGSFLLGLIRGLMRVS